ncbi:flagellar hook protein FlgE [Anaeromyxobacter diazotrophicus]|uniref:Flagellar hook protein FlgE n=1 Tax=Anaeromyxobacter diazotrophicus TaxID=2590199 RepID=A0A7I9VLK8_9BACT|nr:flagellar hook protein FlgE [Anaeromyxobacter diazotrophicus]GEJ56989.1 flagellar hook protein FlgE [Anaeromyxobacter diazotrophicus]
MSLLTSLASGTSGLASASTELAVIGDNIANSNTVGFKAERAAFEDALAQTVIGGAGQIGLGSRLQAVQKLITQGALSNTGVSTDLALQGGGFFEVRGTTGDGRNGTYVTRAGQFTVDRTGFLVNLDGLRVQGYGADAAGNVTSAVGDLQVGNASSAPQPTTTISLKANLQSDAVIPAAWDPTQPAATSNFSTSVTIYDSLGKADQAQVYFRRSGAGTWEWHAVTDGSAVAGGTAGVPSEIAGGTLTFDSNGLLTAQTQASSFNPLNATAPQALAFNFGTPTGAGGSGLDGITQFASASATTFVGQDGFAPGELTSVQIDKKGTVMGIFTNGQSRALGQVGVARVAAPDQLERVGGNLYALTPSSGDAVMGAAGDGGRAYISAGTLEQSNVDIAEQFVRMIAAQRAFEANSKTITTSDQLLSELIQMKR